LKLVFENPFPSICFNIEPFSKTTDFNPSLLETLSDEMNSIDEGIQRMLQQNSPQTVEIQRITPSVTINRRQNLPGIFQTAREVCDRGFDIEVK
jgi:hypothetical protein